MDHRGSPKDTIFKFFFFIYKSFEGFHGGSVGKQSACNAGDPGLIPGLGKSPGERKGYPLQYSCLENSMDRLAGAWQATVLGISKSKSFENLINLFVAFLAVLSLLLSGLFF